MEKLVYQLRGVSFAYAGKITALSGIDLDIHAGSNMALIGANGTGKSTLLMLLDGLISPSAGTLQAFGAALSEAAFQDENFSRNFRTKVGYVFQNSDIQLFCPTVREDIVFGPLQLGVPAEAIRERLAALARRFKIESLLDRSPFQLSAGEKKKAALASVLIMEPEVLLLDEPTAGLDPQTVRTVIDVMLEFHEAGKTIVTATHDLYLVAELNCQTAVLSDGHGLEKTGPAADILRDQSLLLKANLVHEHRHAHGGDEHTHIHLHDKGEPHG